jgi:hypothetical protein
VSGGWRFLVLDLNHFQKDGGLHAYGKGNYFTGDAGRPADHLTFTSNLYGCELTHSADISLSGRA